MTREKLKSYHAKKAEAEALREEISKLHSESTAAILRQQLEEAEHTVNEIAAFIRDCPNSNAKAIMTLMVYEDFNLEQVGKKLHQDRRTVSRALNKVLEPESCPQCP